MSDLHTIHQLLREEYAASKHIFWLDEKSGKVVNDVSHTLNLIVETAKCLRRGDEDCWKQLVAYCIERSMSYMSPITTSYKKKNWLTWLLHHNIVEKGRKT
jgi:hypothetical protein